MTAAWHALPKLKLPIKLAAVDDEASQAVVDELPMPAGSALTIARLDPQTGALHALRWRGSGLLGFYPASTVKLATGVLLLRILHELDPAARFHAWQIDSPDYRDEPVSAAWLLHDMIAHSGNEAFNQLHELVGTAETRDLLAPIGMTRFVIRRHFTRPHWTRSGPAVLHRTGAGRLDRPARPDVEMSPNADGGESNWACSDDLVKLIASVFATDDRDLPGFDVLADALAKSNERFLGRGTDWLGGLNVYSKPGWWPGDGANVDAAYVHDDRQDQHYFAGVYYQGELSDARRDLGNIVATLFDGLRAGTIRLGATSRR